MTKMTIQRFMRSLRDFGRHRQRPAQNGTDRHRTGTDRRHKIVDLLILARFRDRTVSVTKLLGQNSHPNPTLSTVSLILN